MPHPALPYVRPSPWAPCLQPGLGPFLLDGHRTTLLEAPTPTQPPAAPSWTPAGRWTRLIPGCVGAVTETHHLPPALPTRLRPQGIAPHDGVIPAQPPHPRAAPLALCPGTKVKIIRCEGCREHKAMANWRGCSLF